ncbi:POU domain, class 2, transcription factor 3 [Orchesella cincta]|uniref:POU domain, class 2, transcription factor 3 n=1 Tax=Orchesella cincta TaxID=48709 RepID=A0A1D2MBY7_ORCCI|nr:POU domain, class 2, transcription factor 3 [Orchesella cincta]
MQSPIDENTRLEELEEFIINFRMRRLKLVGKLYGKALSQPTNFPIEVLNLSYYKMCNLQSLLQKWLEETEDSLKHSSDLTGLYPLTTCQPIERGRCRRTIISPSERDNLTRAFQHNPKPTSEEFVISLRDLEWRRKFVRIWFYNR